ncbi:MAG: hypothetical protein E7H33_09540 [Clostridium perfringens]|nr:hypothetical protein [Clostridium perfringens]
MRKENNINNRIGERKIMNCGEECEVVEYRKYNDITVMFIKTGELVKSTYNNFKRMVIKSHFTPTVYGVGIVGLEETWVNGKHFKSYKTWHSMLQRCYDEKELRKFPTYKDCSVCDEWLYYPNFKQWYDENYYEIDNEKMALDKDILVKGNKVYSPETCIFVPERINGLFIKKNANRGNLPIGIIWNKRDKKYQANCNVFDIKNNKSKNKHLGYFNTSQEAFKVYKKAKEETIKLAAEYYKDCIPQKLYKAMYKYEVHIND